MLELSRKFSVNKLKVLTKPCSAGAVELLIEYDESVNAALVERHALNW
jgi:hypothetical protein